LKQLYFVLLILGLSITPGHIFSASPLGIGQRFLDLPDGFSITEEEEDAPEFIEFYSNEYEGDAWFFCLDKSDSMSNNTAGGSPKYMVRNRETIKALSALTKRSTATCLFFDWKKENSDIFGDPPLRMDNSGKARMIAQVSRMTVANHSGSDSCINAGMLRILRVVNKSTNSYRVIMLVADGRAQCSGDTEDPNRIFQSITSNNIHRVPINTVYTGAQSGDDWTIGKPLLERLARATGGKFKIAQ
jgi:hypothetical protein